MLWIWPSRQGSKFVVWYRVKQMKKPKYHYILLSQQVNNIARSMLHTVNYILLYNLLRLITVDYYTGFMEFNTVFNFVIALWQMPVHLSMLF